jgi:hypothetical protein
MSHKKGTFMAESIQKAAYQMMKTENYPVMIHCWSFAI